jgi:hypothetical protein
MIHIEQSQAPILEKDIEQTEGKLGVRLPDDYRTFLLKHNGGTPTPDFFPIHGYGAAAGSTLDWFYGIHKQHTYDLIWNATISKGRMPRELLPIAEAAFGDEVCLVVAGPLRGKIYFWVHDAEVGEGEPPTWANTYYVANSFTELLGNLQEHPPYDL